MAVAAAAAFPACALAMPAPGNTHFPRYQELEPNVAFWSDVFTKWTSKQIAFHDVDHLELVYSVLSIDDIVARLPESQQDDAIAARRKAEGERISAMLQEIAGGNARTEEERRILKTIAKIGQEPSYATTLAEQVRSQRGLADKFCDAATRAEAYRPMMARILASYDIPEELLALPLVESGYKIGARSSAGASGIWQFMPSTGRLFLDINSSYDDRRDPERSTEAAARMLRKTYDELGSWPLAITSYNHGPGGVARAVKDMGTTHFGIISRQYKGKAFGFASRNYYAEFLAAVDALHHTEELCGPITAQAYNPDSTALGASASIRDLARAAGTNVDRLADLNPALSDGCVRGSSKVPRGYRLNLPAGGRNEFEVAFGHIDHSDRSGPALLARVGSGNGERDIAPVQRTHHVVKGESLGMIARRYGTTETTLLYLNNLRNAKTVKVGMTLRVPADRVTQAVADANIAHPPFSKTMTTTAGLIAAQEAGKAAAAATIAARTAAIAAPAAVIQKQDQKQDADEQVASNQAPPPPDTAAPAASRHSSAPAASHPAAPAVVAKQSQQGSADDNNPVLTTEHKVGHGQTLTQIASMYHTSVDELKKMNGISEAASVQAGQTIKVRASGSDIVSQATVGRTYKVHPGETLWSVARANDTSVETLKRLNPKMASDGLRSGQTIKVPAAGAVAVASRPARDDTSKASASGRKVIAKAPPKNSYRNHRVQKGQTLSSIAQKYNTSVETLKRINNLHNASNVPVGKTLKVPL
ncbi:MAG TPA: LysM peptidoglycan-binding domain-containing protein [Candidatus Binatia bacterium]